MCSLSTPQRRQPRWIGILTLLLGAALACLGGCRSKRGGLSKAEARWVLSQADKTHTPRDRRRLQALTWSALRHQKKMKTVLPSLRRTLAGEALDGEDQLLLSMLLERQCRAHLGGRFGDNPRWRTDPWKVCGFERHNLATPSQRARWRGRTRWAAVLYELLREAKVRSALARVLSRAWLHPHPRLARGGLAVSQLPRSRSERRLDARPLLTIGTPTLLLDGKPLATKLGKPRLVNTDALAKALSAARKASKAPWPPDALAVLAAGTVPSGAIRQVARLAGRAGFHRLHLVLRGPDDEPVIREVYTNRAKAVQSDKASRHAGRLALATLRSAPLDGRGKTPLGLRLQVRATGGIALSSRHGPECQDTSDAPSASVCVPRPFDKAGIRRLTHRLWTLFAAKYKDPSSYAHSQESRHTLRLSADDAVPYAELILALEAATDIPRDAVAPRSPTAIPPGGCQRSYDRKRKLWFYPEVRGINLRERACMYDAPILQ